MKYIRKTTRVLKWLDYTGKLLIVKIMGKIKLRVTNFEYVIVVIVTIMHINFQTKLQVSLKVMAQLIYYWSK